MLPVYNTYKAVAFMICVYRIYFKNDFNFISKLILALCQNSYIFLSSSMHSFPTVNIPQQSGTFAIIDEFTLT